MSSDMPEPWLSIAEPLGLDSYRKLASASGLSTATVHGALTGKRRTVHPDTITGLAKALRVTEAWVSEALGMGRQSVQPYTPPAEAAYLDTRQRAAVDEMIRLLAQPSTTPTSAPTEQEKSSKTASAATPDPAVAYDDVAQAKLAEVLQSDYTPAASPHAQPDPHNGVGEENQDKE